MLFDKNKVYGYDEDYVLEYGEPADNRITQVGNDEQTFTLDEIHRMFPEQILVLSNMNYSGVKYFSFIISASVAYFHCSYKEALEKHHDGSGNYLYYTTFTGMEEATEP